MDTPASRGGTLVQLRVRIPDHPGSLGRVARTLGEAGADIVQVMVLEQGGGQAVDDFVVSCPSAQVRESLVDVLEAVPDVRVQGVWRAVTKPGAAPEVELLAQLVADRARAARILVDAVPELFNGDWAALLDLAAAAEGAEGAEGVGPAGAAVVHASLLAPAVIDPSLLGTGPAQQAAQQAALQDGTRVAVAPVGRPDLVLVVVRGDAPPFHPTEISRLALLAHVTATLRTANECGTHSI